MCGRFEIHSAVELIARIFAVSAQGISIDFKHNFNVAPTNYVPIVIKYDKRKLIQSRWGFLPSWAKEEKLAYKMINARAETVAEKPAFRDAFKNHRCLVVADGFYEWRTTEAGKKPVYIHLKSGKPMGFAGLYSIWTSPEGEKINTCTIIVTNANDLVAPVHDRMPVIVDPDDQDTWLDPAVKEPIDLVHILKTYPSDELEMYNVSPKVNSPKNNTSDLIKEIA